MQQNINNIIPLIYNSSTMYDLKKNIGKKNKKNKIRKKKQGIKTKK